MEVIDRIKRCKNDEQLYWLTKKLIKDAINESKSDNPYKGLIGARLDVNPTNYNLTNEKDCDVIYSVDIWNGYIPKGTKIVYGTIYNKYNYLFSCGGYYYYVDDETYVYDFIKYIKDMNIEDEFDLVSIVNEYTKKIFNNNLNGINRQNLHKLLFKDNYLQYHPIKEHSIKDFYHTGSAQCTEYAAVANNLFSVLGIPISYFNDKKHAFNVLFHQTDDDKYDSYILDFSDCTFIYNEKLECVGRFPFFKKIENGDNEFINSVVNKGQRIKIDDYNILFINGSMFECKTGKVRDYGVEHDAIEEKKLILK